MRVHLAASRIHKWLALIIGAQLLIWFASGTIMSFLPIEKVRGEHLVERERAVALPQGAKLIAPTAIVSRTGLPVESIAFRMVDGRPVAEAVAGGKTMLFDGVTGTPMPPIEPAAAARIAAAAWKAPAKPERTVSRVTAESPEYRGPLPAWRVSFADRDSTSVFVAAATGRVTGVRTGTWRLYDFFWSLHIMDWKNHEDFNTWWLLAFAFGGLLLGLAGTVLLLMRWPFKRRRPRTVPTL